MLTKRQEDILTAGIRIFANEGSRALTMKKIAGGLGLTEAAIYRHFKGKKALLIALYHYVKKILLEKVSPILASDAPHSERLRSIISVTLNYLLENRGVTLVLLAESIYQKDAVIEEAMKELFTAYTSLVETLIEAGITGGAFDPGCDACLAATAIAGMMQGTLTRHLLANVPLDPEKAAEALTEIMLYGISKKDL